jgi:hypothetical protein
MLAEVVSGDDFKLEVEDPIEELFGIEQQGTAKGVMKKSSYTLSPLFASDEELLNIIALIDEMIINRLLVCDGYSPAMGEIFSCNLLRAELLQAISTLKSVVVRFVPMNILD